ncbi:MAG: hypothetical protein A3D28_04325 [Omnitrophica bacterium RIFCSPHIGHO2_02_FULL_63_14]|nr:MAG: hypothetical protein A3D28_04325 [Omnitrophica bacterium RIFCSPHIGHO2_02_FULL_63_14]
MKEFISTLIWVDYVVLIVVVWGFFIGYRSGFFPELLRVAAYLVTVVATLKYHQLVAQYLTLKTFLNLTSATAVSFAVLLVGVFLIMKLITAIILRLLKLKEGKFLSRIMGAALGSARWVILLSLFFMALDYSPLTSLKTDIHERSVVGKKVALIAPTIFNFLTSLSPQLGPE